MSEVNGTPETVDDRALTRRRMLKGAAAAGVGAVAWSAPNIKTLGFAPAYAAVCTLPVTITELSARNTACNCGNQDPAGKYVSYKEFGSPCGGGTPGGGVAEMRQDSCAGALIGNSGKCPSPDADNAGVCVSAVPANNKCKIVVLVTDGNCAEPPVVAQTVVSGVFSTAQWVAMPRVPCQGNGNIFVRIRLVCSRSEACLPV